MTDISRLSVKIRSTEQELETSRREAAALRQENNQLRGELAAFASSHRPAPQPQMTNDYPPQNNLYETHVMDTTLTSLDRLSNYRRFEMLSVVTHKHPKL
jgi:hypothetical protein